MSDGVLVLYENMKRDLVLSFDDIVIKRKL